MERKPKIVTQATQVLLFTVPVIFTLFLELFDQTICIAFVGHYGNEVNLAALGLGNMLANIFINIGVRSLNGPLDTYLSQGMGAGNKKYCGVAYNKSIIVLTIIAIPILIILC